MKHATFKKLENIDRYTLKKDRFQNQTTCEVEMSENVLPRLAVGDYVQWDSRWSGESRQLEAVVTHVSCVQTSISYRMTLQTVILSDKFISAISVEEVNEIIQDLRKVIQAL